MANNRFFSEFALLLLIVMILAACGGAPVPQSVSSPTTAPPANTSAPATSAQAPIAAAAPTAAITLTVSNDVTNDATQARLRVGNCVLHGPSVDFVVDGAVAVIGGIPQTGLGAADIGGYLYLAPGTHSVAIVPTGQGSTEALLGPLDVTVAAGHRYTLAMLGQVGDAHNTPLLIDETAAYQAAGASPTGDAHITINNVKGLAGIDFSEAGSVRDQNVPYGGFKAAIWPVGNFNNLLITVSGAPNQVLDSSPDGFNVPGTDNLDCFVGTYPGKIGVDFDTHTSGNTSSLNVIEFLQNFSGKNVKADDGSSWSFDTFLAAIKTAGLTDLFTTGAPYLLFVPTDEAFAALPKATRDALLSDPKAVADLLRAHIVPGYFPAKSLAKTLSGPLDRTVTNMLGAKLVLSGGNDNTLHINGVSMAGDEQNTWVANGIRVLPINKVLPVK